MLGVVLGSQVTMVSNAAILAFWSLEYGRENRPSLSEKKINRETQVTSVLKIMVRNADGEPCGEGGTVIDLIVKEDACDVVTLS